jgi:hypothetical protein
VDVVPVDANARSRAALTALAAKYDQYARRTPPGPLLRLTVDDARHWRPDDRR